VKLANLGLKYMFANMIMNNISFFGENGKKTL